ncbi:MAG: hypothetical protein OD918_03365 [Gammaproteobacteria bacterium]
MKIVKLFAIIGLISIGLVLPFGTASAHFFGWFHPHASQCATPVTTCPLFQPLHSGETCYCTDGVGSYTWGFAR